MSLCREARQEIVVTMRRTSTVAVLVSFGAALTLALLLPAPQAQAQDNRNRSPYLAQEGLELTLSGGLILGSALLPKIFKDEAFAEPPCEACDALQINAMDRPVTGYYSGGAKVLSDITVSTLILAPYALSIADVAVDDNASGFLKDAAVLSQTLGVNLFLMQMVKFSVRRPRPFTYNPEAPLEAKLEQDSSLSFFSGHSSTAFSMAVAYAITYQERHPNDPMRFVVWGSGLGLAATTAGLRVAAGKHFWSDVLVGSLVGTAIGIVVPALHMRPDSGRNNAVEQRSSGAMPIMFSGAF